MLSARCGNRSTSLTVGQCSPAAAAAAAAAAVHLQPQAAVAEDTRRARHRRPRSDDEFCVASGPAGSNGFFFDFIMYGRQPASARARRVHHFRRHCGRSGLFVRGSTGTSMEKLSAQ
jgi:hypothetical protein